MIIQNNNKKNAFVCKALMSLQSWVRASTHEKKKQTSVQQNYIKWFFFIFPVFKGNIKRRKKRRAITATKIKWNVIILDVQRVSKKRRVRKKKKIYKKKKTLQITTWGPQLCGPFVCAEQKTKNKNNRKKMHSQYTH